MLCCVVLCCVVLCCVALCCLRCVALRCVAFDRREPKLNSCLVFFKYSSTRPTKFGQKPTFSLRCVTGKNKRPPIVCSLYALMHKLRILIIYLYIYIYTSKVINIPSSLNKD
jgi:hypothetical protein